jgi:hypothetical protein
MLAYAINRKLTAQVLGNARLVMKPADWAQIEMWIATVSAEGNAAMARWDARGEGYTVDTVAFDLAHLAAREVAMLRAMPGSAKGPVEGCFEATIGDWQVPFEVRQAAKRGDLHLAMGAARPHNCEEHLPDIAIEFIRAGKPVMVWGSDGFVNLTELMRTSFPRPEDI